VLLHSFILKLQKTHKVIHEIASRQTPSDGVPSMFFAQSCVVCTLQLSWQRTRSTPSLILGFPGLYVLYILFRLQESYRIIYPDLTTPKTVLRLFPPELCCGILMPITPSGTPAAENRSSGQPPRILSLEEQGKMRTVCRVGARPFAMDRSSPSVDCPLSGPDHGSTCS
jgi:hypothetical protein